MRKVWGISKIIGNLRLNKHYIEKLAIRQRMINLIKYKLLVEYLLYYYKKKNGIQ